MKKFLSFAGICIFICWTGSRYLTSSDEIGQSEKATHEIDEIKGSDLQSSLTNLPENSATSFKHVHQQRRQRKRFHPGTPLREQIPTQELLRDEIQKDPHSTPPSLLEFANDLTPRLKRALRSEQDASRFFGELRECAESDQSRAVPLTVQAICLSNALVLTDRYPNLRGEYTHLLAHVDQEVIHLIQ